jgi:hypothetical protein
METLVFVHEKVRRPGTFGRRIGCFKGGSFRSTVGNMTTPVPSKADLFGPHAVTDDVTAWHRWPQWRWIYDKTELAHLQGLVHGRMPMVPPRYPVVLKPSTNLYGMGWQAYVLHTHDDYVRHWGHTGMWMPLLSGTHWSLDLVVVDGAVQWWTAWRGTPACRGFGLFQAWNWEHQPAAVHAIVDTVSALLLPRLGGYSGCFNVEAIGETLIEAHLRPGDVAAFLDDAELWCAMHELGETGRWPLGTTYTPSTRVRVLVPVWWPAHLAWDADLETLPPGIVAVDTDVPGASLCGLVRRAVLLCSDEAKGRDFRQVLLHRAIASHT